MNQMSFSLPEIFAILGMVQCTYLIVHILFGGRQVLRGGLPLIYFLLLGAAFTVDFAKNHLEFSEKIYFYLQWFLWFSGPPLSVLLVSQLADMTRMPSLKNIWVLCLLPLVFLLTFVETQITADCNSYELCSPLKDLMNISGLMAGGISLLVIFSNTDIFKNLPKQKYGQERYWLIFSLIVLNVFFLIAMLVNVTGQITDTQAILLRNILGIGFVYLISTTMLRIIPVKARASTSAISAEPLTNDEVELAGKIEKLLKFEKVYQEPTYSRADLAKECDVSEMLLSKIINVHFQKSFPQLMNEHRVEDAKQLLHETDATIQIIAQEVGFNSLPSFNRVFKDMTGQSPSEFRKARTA